MVEFARDYVDRHHHSKEELQVFDRADARVGPHFEEDHRELVQTMRARVLLAR